MPFSGRVVAGVREPIRDDAPRGARGRNLSVREVLDFHGWPGAPLPATMPLNLATTPGPLNLLSVGVVRSSWFPEFPDRMRLLEHPLETLRLALTLSVCCF